MMEIKIWEMENKESKEGVTVRDQSLFNRSVKVIKVGQI